MPSCSKSSQQGQCQSDGEPCPSLPAALQDTQSAKLSFLSKVQQCFAVRKGMEGMLDLARDVFCRAAEQVHELVATYREQHGLDCLKVGTALWPGLPVSGAQGSGTSRCTMQRAPVSSTAWTASRWALMFAFGLLEISNSCRVAWVNLGRQTQSCISY